MMKPIYIFVFASIILVLHASGQELPYGVYSIRNPKCFWRVDGLCSFAIGKDFSFSFRSAPGMGSSYGHGTYENKIDEYAFTFSPRDTSMNISSSFQALNDPTLNTEDFKVLVEDYRNESLIGVDVYFLDREDSIIYRTSTDFDGVADVKEGMRERSNLIRISYVGFDTLEIPIKKVDGNMIIAALGEEPLESVGSTEIHNMQLKVKKTDQGILVKWPYSDEYVEWFHESKWKDEDCY